MGICPDFNLISVNNYLADPKKYILYTNKYGKFSIAERLPLEQEQRQEEFKKIFELAVKPADESSSSLEFRIWSWLERQVTKEAQTAQQILGPIFDKELEYQNFYNAVLNSCPHPIILIRYKDGKECVGQLEQISDKEIGYRRLYSDGKMMQEASESDDIQSIVILEHAENAVERLSEEVKKKIAFDEIKRRLEFESNPQSSSFYTCFFSKLKDCYSYITQATINTICSDGKTLEQMIHDHIMRGKKLTSIDIIDLLLDLDDKRLLEKFLPENKDPIFLYIYKYFYTLPPKKRLLQLFEKVVPVNHALETAKDDMLQALIYYREVKIFSARTFDEYKNLAERQAKGKELIRVLCEDFRRIKNLKVIRSHCPHLIEQCFTVSERAARNEMLNLLFSSFCQHSDILVPMCRCVGLIDEIEPLILPHISKETCNVCWNGHSPLFGLFDALLLHPLKNEELAFKANPQKPNVWSLFQKFQECGGKLIVEEVKLFDLAKIFPVVCKCYRLPGVAEILEEILKSGCSFEAQDKWGHDWLWYLLQSTKDQSGLYFDLQRLEEIINNVYKKFYDKGLYCTLDEFKNYNVASYLLNYLPWEKEPNRCAAFMVNFMKQFPKVVQKHPEIVSRTICRVPKQSRNIICDAFLDCVSEKGCRLHSLCKYASYSVPLQEYLAHEKQTTQDINSLDGAGNSPWYYLFASIFQNEKGQNTGGANDLFFKHIFNAETQIIASKETFVNLLQKNKDAIGQRMNLLADLGLKGLFDKLAPANKELLFLHIVKSISNDLTLTKETFQLLQKTVPENRDLGAVHGEMFHALVFYREREILAALHFDSYKNEAEKRAKGKALLSKLYEDIEKAHGPEILDTISFNLIDRCFTENEKADRNQMLDRCASILWAKEWLNGMCCVPHVFGDIAEWILPHITKESCNVCDRGRSPLGELFYTLSKFTHKQWEGQFDEHPLLPNIRSLFQKFHECGGKLIVEKRHEKLLEQIFPTVCRCYQFPGVPEMVDTILASGCSLKAQDNNQYSGLAYLLKNTWEVPRYVYFPSELDLSHCESIINHIYQKLYDQNIYTIQLKGVETNLAAYFLHELSWYSSSVSIAASKLPAAILSPQDKLIGIDPTRTMQSQPNGVNGAKTDSISEKEKSSPANFMVAFMKRFPKVVLHDPVEVAKGINVLPMMLPFVDSSPGTTAICNCFLDIVSKDGCRLHGACKYAIFSNNLEACLTQEKQKVPDINALDSSGNSPGYYLLDSALQRKLRGAVFQDDTRGLFLFRFFTPITKIISQKESLEDLFVRHLGVQRKKYILHEMCQYAFLPECREYLFKNMDAINCREFDDLGNTPLYYIFTCCLSANQFGDSVADFLKLYKAQKIGARAISKDQSKLALLFPKLCSQIEIPGLGDVISSIIESGCPLNRVNDFNTGMTELLKKCKGDIKKMAIVIEEWYPKLAKKDASALVYLLNKLFPSPAFPTKDSWQPYVQLMMDVVKKYPANVNVAGEYVGDHRFHLNQDRLALARGYKILDLMIDADLFKPNALLISKAEYQDLIAYFFEHGNVANPIAYVHKLFFIHQDDLAVRIVRILLGKKFPLERQFETEDKNLLAIGQPVQIKKSLLEEVEAILKLLPADEKCTILELLTSYVEKVSLEQVPIDRLMKIISEQKDVASETKKKLLSSLFFGIPHRNSKAIDFTPKPEEIQRATRRQLKILFSTQRESEEVAYERLVFQMLRYAVHSSVNIGWITRSIIRVGPNTIRAAASRLRQKWPSWSLDIDRFLLTYFYNRSDKHLKTVVEVFPEAPTNISLDKFYDVLKDLTDNEVEAISQAVEKDGIRLSQDPMALVSNDPQIRAIRLTLQEGIRRRFEDDIYRIVHKERRPIPGYTYPQDALPKDRDAYYEEINYLRLCTLDTLLKKSKDGDYHSLLVEVVKRYVVASEYCGAQFLTTSVDVLEYVVTGKNLIVSTFDRSLGDLRKNILQNIALQIAKEVDADPRTQNQSSPQYFAKQSVHFYNSLVREFGRKWNISVARVYEKMEDPYNYLNHYKTLYPNEWQKKIEEMFFASYTAWTIFETARSWLHDISQEALSDFLKATMPDDFKKVQFVEQLGKVLSLVPNRVLSDEEFLKIKADDPKACKAEIGKLFDELSRYGEALHYEAAEVEGIKTLEEFGAFVRGKIDSVKNPMFKQRMENSFKLWLKDYTAKGKLEKIVGMPLSDAEFKEPEKIWPAITAAFEDERKQQYTSEVTQTVYVQVHNGTTHLEERLQLGTDGLIRVLETMEVLSAV